MARIVRVGSNSSSSSSSDNEQNSGRYIFHFDNHYLSSAQTSRAGNSQAYGSVQESSAGPGRENGGNPRRVYQATNSNDPPFQNFVPSSRRMTPEQQSNTPNHDNHASIISIFSQIEENVKLAISANENSKIPYDQLYGLDYCKVIIDKYSNEIYKGFSATEFVFANCVYEIALILIAREKKMYDVILGNHKINGRNVCDEIMQNGFLRFKLMTAIERNLMGLSEYTYQFPDFQKALEEYTTIKVLVSLIPDFMVLAKKIYSFHYQQNLLIKNLMAKYESDKSDYKVRYPTVAKTYVDSLAGHMTPDMIGHINQSPEEIDKIHANVSALCYMVHHYILKKEQPKKQRFVQGVKSKLSIEKVTVLTKRSINKKPSKLGKVHYEVQFYH